MTKAIKHSKREQPLNLYIQSEPNTHGIEGVHIIIDESVVHRMRQGLENLVQHNWESLSYCLGRGCWLLDRDSIEKFDTTVRLWSHGHGMYSFTFSAAINRATEHGCFDWVYPSAEWSLPVSLCDFSLQSLSEHADSELNLIESRIVTAQNEKSSSEVKWLSALTVHRMSAANSKIQRMTGHVDLWGEALPVQGLPFDVIRLQQWLGAIDELPTHCLDIGDLQTLFMRDGCWTRLSVRAVYKSQSISACLGDIKQMCPDSVCFCVLGSSVESLKLAKNAVDALWDSNSPNLYIPVLTNEVVGEGGVVLLYGECV